MDWDLAGHRPFAWQESRLLLLDQRLLPGEERWTACDSPDQVAEAIRSMLVRGAPAIGIAAAFGMALAARHSPGEVVRAHGLLAASRPTAVNLFWALARMSPACARGADAAMAEARAMADEDEAACRAIGRFGAALIPDGSTVLTHCNAGALATGGYGTALGVIRAAIEQGKRLHVLADETRPYLQGARLTAWELVREGIPVEVIADGMAGHFMQRGEIACAIVGADRIARNGDVANKIGTYGLAVLCQAHALPLYVAAPTSTLDLQIASGVEIPIEERDSDEVARIGGMRVVPVGVRARHPAFDVTPARLVRALITERGLAEPPGERSIAALFER